jgi:hypothetical protein
MKDVSDNGETQGVVAIVAMEEVKLYEQDISGGETSRAIGPAVEERSITERTCAVRRCLVSVCLWRKLLPQPLNVHR